MCIGKLKTSTNNYNLFVDKDYILFCVPDQNQIDTSTVKFKYSTRYIEALLEKNDPHALNLRVRNNNDYIYLLLIFDDINTLSTLKKELECLKNIARDKELVLLTSYFEEICNK